MATRIYKTPFAATGDKEALATADQPDGKVSLQAGWTPDYELPNDNANYRPVGRAEMNGVFNELTAALGEMQLTGFAKWQTIDGGWPLGAQVSHNALTYRSTGDANTTEPGTVGAAWVPMGSGIATTAQAQAMTDDATLLTPKTLDDAFMGANQAIGPANFFQRYPGGLLVQGGNLTASTADFLVTFPIAFAAPPTSVVATVAGNPGTLIGALVDLSTTTNFAARVRNASGGVGNQAIDWVAYGRWK
ncbi:hypothetical protein ABE485_02835 [Achromobacter spanius]|uniref:gp53-like domain-containing protein n=1 Tax=Achromobacter spanius TaxID=217203 RepID=UPI00320B1157